MDRSVRGSVLNAYLRFVEKKWGKDGLQQCVKDIGLDGVFRDGEYYRDEFRENILRWLEREKGQTEVIEGGRFVVKNLGLLGWLVKFASPKVIAESFPKNFSEVYTFGKVKIEAVDKGRIVMRLYDVNRVDVSCASWIGVCEGVLDMTRTKGTVKKTKCVLKGDVYCEYVTDYHQ
jgi:hypothetical protein